VTDPAADQTTIEMRRRTTVKVGDTLLFHPHIEALAGENSAFFRKYQGMKAEVLGFEADEIERFVSSVQRLADSNGPAEVIGRDFVLFHGSADQDKTESPQRTGRIFVRFENGDMPRHSIFAAHFIVP
jgi:hypothetical protein